MPTIARGIASKTLRFRPAQELPDNSSPGPGSDVPARTTLPRYRLKYSLVVERLRNFVTQSSRLHPANSKQIPERFEQSVPHAVMTPAGTTRVVRHRHFGNTKAFELD